MTAVRLADYIENNEEPILAEWQAFAATCGPVGAAMNAASLRDHARAMLRVIVTDLRTPQTDVEQVAKSKGEGDGKGGPETAAEVHGAGRAEDGFTVGEMVSEYRALRASVIRLWTKASGTLTGDDFDDLVRFNETIDQSLAESITRYTEDLGRAKEMFLAVLGHDLRSPLNAVIMASQFMLETEELVEPHRTLVERTLRSGRRMNTMVGDLLDFTRTRLGAGIPIVRKPMDLGKEANHAVDEVSAAHPDCKLHIVASGDLHGEWDCPRISQVLSNLLNNAVQHGTPKSEITFTIRGEADDVMLEVHNWGAAIAPESIAGLFSPFKRLASNKLKPHPTSLGLGLYIVERIVSAHGGTIRAASTSEGGTLFTVRLPRAERAVAA